MLSTRATKSTPDSIQAINRAGSTTILPQIWPLLLIATNALTPPLIVMGKRSPGFTEARAAILGEANVVGILIPWQLSGPPGPVGGAVGRSNEIEEPPPLMILVRWVENSIKPKQKKAPSRIYNNNYISC
jgi:hypothetical protein